MLSHRADFKTFKQIDMEEFNVGDTVKLKSGGPLMTVHDILSTYRVICKWFAKDASINAADFQKESLRKVHSPLT